MDSSRSDDTQRPLERISFKARSQRHMNSWQTEECMNPVRGYRDWQKRFIGPVCWKSAAHHHGGRISYLVSLLSLCFRLYNVCPVVFMPPPL